MAARLARKFQILHRNQADTGPRPFQIRLYQPRYGKGRTHAANLQRDLCDGRRAGRFDVETNFVAFQVVEALDPVQKPDNSKSESSSLRIRRRRPLPGTPSL